MKLFKNLVQVSLLVSVAMVSTAYARTPVPIQDHDNISIAASAAGKPVSAEQVRQAIIVGGARRAWTFVDSGAGQLTGTLVVRNKHTVVVTVDYTTKSYSIHYKDSSNMQYKTEYGASVIHPFYNSWVGNLTADVNAELAKLQ